MKSITVISKEWRNLIVEMADSESIYIKEWRKEEGDIPEENIRIWIHEEELDELIDILDMLSNRIKRINE